MIDQIESTSIDVKTRANLAYIWSIAVIVMVSYTFITGTASTVLAVYFGAPIGTKKPDTNITATGDSPIVNNSPTQS